MTSQKKPSNSSLFSRNSVGQTKERWRQLKLFPETENSNAEAIIKIFLADSHTMVREGIKRILESSPDIAIVGEAENDADLLPKLRDADCNMVLLDISNSEGNGFNVLQELKKMRPELPVLALSVYPEGPHAVQAIRSGASGYLTKEKTTVELLNAIQKISSGKRYISLSLAEKLTFDLGSAIKNPDYKNLSDREFQVMYMIASGKSLKEIAEALSLSIHTVSTYKSRLLEKMNMKSTAEIIYYAIKEGLIS